MNEQAVYDTKRAKFIEKVPQLFKFLISEYGYSNPDYTRYEQKNGFVISDRFEYQNDSIDRLIRIHNDYHPVDYGFEIEIYRPSISLNQGDRLIVVYVPKEDQDISQGYLSEAAAILRDRYRDVIDGRDWQNSI